MSEEFDWRPRYRFSASAGRWRRVTENPFNRDYLCACIKCGGLAQNRFPDRAECIPCRQARYTELNRISGRAHALVNMAVISGTLPKLDGGIKCSDCEAPARVYDHRDYDKPLEVDPVCRSCNAKRGPAKGIERLHIRRRA